MRSGKNKAGFTLLEVLLASVLLALFLVPLLGGVISALGNIQRSRNLQIARQLAMNKLAELRLEKVPELEIEQEGDFTPEYPQFHWRIQYQKIPELELLETQIAGLRTMEIVLTVSWEEAGETRELTLVSLLAQ